MSVAAPLSDSDVLAAVRLALRIDETESDPILVRNIAAAQALAARRAPGAPDAVKTEAIIRACAVLYEGAAAIGDSPAAVWRNSGAEAVLAPWTVRRAGAIG